MLPNPDAGEEYDTEQRERGINMVGIYRTVLRVIAHLEETDYTGQNSRQAEVLKHRDLPDPASSVTNSQG
jgi:hypothetical protein